MNEWVKECLSFLRSRLSSASAGQSPSMSSLGHGVVLTWCSHTKGHMYFKFCNIKTTAVRPGSHLNTQYWLPKTFWWKGWETAQPRLSAERICTLLGVIQVWRDVTRYRAGAVSIFRSGLPQPATLSFLMGCSLGMTGLPLVVSPFSRNCRERRISASFLFGLVLLWSTQVGPFK